MLLPLKAELASGETLSVGMVFTDFGSINNGNFPLSTDPTAYAAMVVAFANRLRDNYGTILEHFNMTLEPDKTDTSFSWTGTRIGNALVALRSALNSAGFPNVNLIAPDVTDANKTVSYSTRSRRCRAPWRP